MSCTSRIFCPKLQHFLRFNEEGSECREAKENRVSVEMSESKMSEPRKREDSQLRVAREREESELRVASLAIKKIV